jgi:hypothetical protein
MKTEKDKEIDDLFKRGLEPSDAGQGHMEEDWSAMEQMLREQKKRPVIIYWLPILGSVAAVLLLVIGWWLLRPIVNPRRRETQQMAANKIDKDSLGDVKSKVIPEGKTTQKSQIAKNTGTITPPEVLDGQNLHNHHHVADMANNITTGRRAHNYKNNNIVRGKDGSLIKQDNNTGVQIIGHDRQYTADLIAYNPGTVINGQQSINGTIEPGNFLSHEVSNRSVQISKRKTSFAYRPQFALTVLAASDKNGVGSFQQTKPGNNAGLMLSMSLGKRFVITTGAVYDAKQYISSFANYHTTYQFPTDPVSVLANCKMFDIPLNIDYRVFNTYRNKISVGTGVSSYLMLNESYQYNYPEYGASGPARYNVPNPDKYLFSIINFQATYERQINSNVGITLQPYMKLPLSAVGASQVRLQSTGVAVGLTWNLRSSSKP